MTPGAALPKFSRAKTAPRVSVGPIFLAGFAASAGLAPGLAVAEIPAPWLCAFSVGGGFGHQRLACGGSGMGGLGDHGGRTSSGPGGTNGAARLGGGDGRLDAAGGEGSPDARTSDDGRGSALGRKFVAWRYPGLPPGEAFGPGGPAEAVTPPVIFEGRSFAGARTTGAWGAEESEGRGTAVGAARSCASAASASSFTVAAAPSAARESDDGLRISRGAVPRLKKKT